MSHDGRYAVFVSDAANLVPGQLDSNDTGDRLPKDQVTGQIWLVSHSSQALVQTGTSGSGNPSISADGRFVAFESRSTGLVAGMTDTDINSDVFLFDRVTGAVTLVSRQASNPTQPATGLSKSPAISADGRFVAYA